MTIPIAAYRDRIDIWLRDAARYAATGDYENAATAAAEAHDTLTVVVQALRNRINGTRRQPDA